MDPTRRSDFFQKANLIQIDQEKNQINENSNKTASNTTPARLTLNTDQS
jgi:hypothetical protein